MTKIIRLKGEKMTTKIVPELDPNFTSVDQEKLEKKRKFWFGVPATLKREKSGLNRGQKEVLAVMWTFSLGYGYFGYNAKKIKDIADILDMAPATVSKYISVIVKANRAIDITDSQGRRYLIAHESAARAQQEIDKFRAKAKEEGAFDAAMAQAKADEAPVVMPPVYGPAEAPQDGPQDGASPSPQPADISEPSGNISQDEAKLSEELAEVSAPTARPVRSGRKVVRFSRKTVRSVEMRIGGGMNPESDSEGIGNKTATPTPANLAGVGESRVREDALTGAAAREDAVPPVVVVVGNSASEDTEQEGTAGEGDEFQDGHDPMLDDPFADNEPDQEIVQKIIQKPASPSLGPATDGEAKMPPPAAKPVQMPAERPVEAAKKAVSQYLGTKAVNASERAFSVIVTQIAEEFDVPTATVEALVGGVPADRQATALVKALTDFKTKDPKTTRIPWSLLSTIALAKAEKEIEEAAKAPVIHMVENTVKAEFSDDQKTAISAHLDGLDADGKAKLLSETAALMKHNARGSKSLVGQNSRKLVAERLGIPVKTDWKATAEELAEVVPVVSKKIGRVQGESVPPKMTLVPDCGEQTTMMKAFLSSPEKAQYTAMAEKEFAEKFPGITFKASIIDQRAANLFAQKTGA